MSRLWTRRIPKHLTKITKISIKNQTQRAGPRSNRKAGTHEGVASRTFAALVTFPPFRPRLLSDDDCLQIRLNTVERCFLCYCAVQVRILLPAKTPASPLFEQYGQDGHPGGKSQLVDDAEWLALCKGARSQAYGMMMHHMLFDPFC